MVGVLVMMLGLIVVGLVCFVVGFSGLCFVNFHVCFPHWPWLSVRGLWRALAAMAAAVIAVASPP